MRLVVLAALIVGSMGGLLGSLALGELSGRAGAVPPAQSVREQNLDGGGFIKVHEQGTANVTGTVNVGNLPDGRVTLVAENLNLGPGDFFRSDWVDTSDCSRLATFIDPPANPSLWLSPDGVTVSAAVGPGEQIGGITYFFDLDFGPVVAPMAAVAFGEGVVVNKAWLFCSP